MVTVSEVVVKATPEGISETTDGLEEVESATKETTDQMGEQSEEMSSFAQSFQGSMGAILAGLGVATAGLLSQVPVIGEAFSGLTAVVDAVALRLDSVLRPVFGPITNKLMNLADTIATADGKFGLFLDVIITVAAILGTIAGIAVVVATAATVLAGSIGTLVTVGGALATAIGVIAGALSLPLVLLGLLAVGVLLLIDRFIGLENIWNGLMSRITSGIETLKTLAHIFGTVAPAKFDEMVAGIKQGVRDAIQPIVGFVTDVERKFDSLVRRAKEWGRGLLERFIQGIRSKIGDLKGVVGNTEIADGVSVNDITGSASSAVSGATEEAGGFIGSVGDSANKIFLDGKRVDDNQGRFRKDSLTRRGG